MTAERSVTPLRECQALVEQRLSEWRPTLDFEIESFEANSHRVVLYTFTSYVLAACYSYDDGHTWTVSFHQLVAEVAPMTDPKIQALLDAARAALQLIRDFDDTEHGIEECHYCAEELASREPYEEIAALAAALAAFDGETK